MKKITSFKILGINGIIRESSKTITIKVPFGTALTTLVPTITYTGSSISPLSGTVGDFTNPKIYTVTATDGSTQDYVVTVCVAPDPAIAIAAAAVAKAKKERKERMTIGIVIGIVLFFIFGLIGAFSYSSDDSSKKENATENNDATPKPAKTYWSVDFNNNESKDIVINKGETKVMEVTAPGATTFTKDVIVENLKGEKIRVLANTYADMNDASFARSKIYGLEDNTIIIVTKLK